MVKVGYKQTEVGVVPEDWLDRSVGQLIAEGFIEKPLDGNHGNIHPKSGDFVEYGIPFVMANNVHDGQVDLVNCSFIRKEQADSLQKGFSTTGDVLLTHKATIGNTAIVGEIPFDYIMLTPQVTYYRVADSNRLNNLYLRQFFDSTGFQSILRTLAGGGTRSYIGIKAQHQLPVVLPPTVIEQQAIATALSDVDGLIESLERLVSKKRNLKQGAMQELLTGKKRLPGFSGGWEVKRFGELCDYVDGITTSGGDLGYLEIGDVNVESKTYDVSQKEKPSVRGAVKVPAGTLLISTVRPTRGAIAITKSSLHVSSAFCRVRPVNGLLFHMVCQPKFLTYLGENSIGGTYPTCRDETILSYESALPSDSAEQTAIASILSDMDAEIQGLETKLTKTRLLKQGMMQELLTGRIRLV